MSAWMRLTLGVLASALLAHEAAAQPPSPTAANARGRVSGRVVSTNAGLLADAIVTLAHISDDGVPRDQQMTRSDQRGGFTFERVPAGRYQLSASKPGFTNRQPVSIDAVRSRPGFETASEIMLRDGEQALGLELTLRRAARIAGRIAEPDGIPAPDVQVFAAVPRGQGYALLPDTGTTTEWDGRYEMTGLPPGEYLVVVLPLPRSTAERALANAERRAPEAPASTRPSFEAALYPGVPATEPGQRVTLLEGVAAEGIDVWLTPAQRYTVSGRVIWPDGLTVENIAIEYANLAARRSGLWVVSDPGGLFTISGVAAGTHVLLARADSDQGPLAGVASTDVRVGPVDDVRLTLGRTGTIGGRVTYEVDVPALTRPRAITLRQTLVHVSALYPAPESPIRPDGRFQIRHAFGEYAFELRGLPTGMRIKGVSRGGRVLPNSRLNVTAGEDVTDVEVLVGK